MSPSTENQRASPVLLSASHLPLPHGSHGPVGISRGPHPSSGPPTHRAGSARRTGIGSSATRPSYGSAHACRPTRSGTYATRPCSGSPTTRHFHGRAHACRPTHCGTYATRPSYGNARRSSHTGGLRPGHPGRTRTPSGHHPQPTGGTTPPAGTSSDRAS